MKSFPDICRFWAAAAGIGLCLLLSARDAAGEHLTATVLKSMGNLVVLDIGASSTVCPAAEYRLYRMTPGGPLPDPSGREGYLGIWTVTQVFGEFTIGRFLVSGADVTARIGDSMALFPFQPVGNGWSAAGGVSASAVQTEPRPTGRGMLQAPKGINLTPGTNLPWPVSVGFSGLSGYANFSNQIVQSIQDFQQDLFDGGVLTEQAKIGVGFGMDVQALTKPTRGLRLSYRQIQNVNDLSGQRTAPPPDPDIEYTNAWTMETATTVHTLALTFLWGNFRPVYDQYMRSERVVEPRRFGWYYGGGLDCAWIRYKTKERAELMQSGISRFVNNNQAFTLGQYWGMHLVGGVTYNFPAVRTFIELNGILWTDRDFGTAFPLRAGFEIFF